MSEEREQSKGIARKSPLEIQTTTEQIEMDSQFKTCDVVDVGLFPLEIQTKILASLNFRRETVEIDGVKYMRDARRKVVYRKTGNGYECVSCKSQITSMIVYRPKHEGPFDGAGFGEVWMEHVPYCPKCEQEPQVYNTPIRIPWMK